MALDPARMSFLDWRQAALEATDLLEKRRLLEQAERRAEHATELCDLARDYVDLEDPVTARRLLTLAQSPTPGNEKAWLDAAHIVARLGDAATARALIERFSDHLRGSPVSSRHDWWQVAYAYKHAAGDDEATRAALVHAVGCCKGVSDLCHVATAYRELLGDRATAAALVARAEEQAVAKRANWPAIASAYRFVLEDREGERASLARGLALAETSSACTSIAGAWYQSEFDDAPAQTVAALEHARTFARTAREWYFVANAYREYAKDSTAVRACLERSVAANPDDYDRQALAQAYRHWLDDAAAAALTWKSGKRPDELLRPVRELRGWTADANGLFDWLRGRLDDEMLRTIAGADWGFDFDDHLAALREMATTGLIPQPLGWYPLEVLSLAHHSTSAGDSPVMTAFCATVLVDIDQRSGTESTLAILLQRCRELGPEAMSRLTPLLVALVRAVDYEGGAPALFAIFALVLAAATEDAHDARLPGLIDWLITLETEGDDPHPEHGWLLRTTHFDSSHKLWRQLAREILTASDELPSFVDLRRRMSLDCD